jgi:hypothetical protein
MERYFTETETNENLCEKKAHQKEGATVLGSVKIRE